jgi:hypothetical protein
MHWYPIPWQLSLFCGVLRRGCRAGNFNFLTPVWLGTETGPIQKFLPIKICRLAR